MNHYVPAEPFHPGEYISDELEARGWTQDDLAEVLGISRRHVINLVTGKSGVTPEIAIALGQAFGQDPKTWMNLQVSYELAQANQKDREIERRANLYARFPVREMRRRQWISESQSTEGTEKSICEFLKIPCIEDEPAIQVAARKSSDYGVDTMAQKAWFRRVEQLAQHAPASAYSDRNFEPAIRDLLALAANSEDVRRVPKFLAEMGVRLVVVEHLKGTGIDGVALWLDEQSPVVGLSLRYDRIDNFWFTLFHELVHIKHRDKSPPVDVDVMNPESGELPEIEKRANSEAANYLIPTDKLASFIARTKPLYYEKKVVQFAQARGVHPGIVVGQLQRRKELTYAQLRKLLAKVRSEILGQAISDGWGNNLNLDE